MVERIFGQGVVIFGNELYKEQTNIKLYVFEMAQTFIIRLISPDVNILVRFQLAGKYLYIPALVCTKKYMYIRVAQNG